MSKLEKLNQIKSVIMRQSQKVSQAKKDNDINEFIYWLSIARNNKRNYKSTLFE